MGVSQDLAPRASSAASASTGRRIIEIAVGALVVAIAAQVAVPVPLNPVPMTLQPLAVLAVRSLMEKTRTTIGDYDLIEANEAFAVQALADGRELGWDWDRVNVNGGAVALGHPIGASGARVLTTLLYALRDRGGRRGLATLCLGGGNAVALSVELL